MNVPVTVAILGAAVTVIGWLTTYILSEIAGRRRQNLIAQLDYTRQQVEELYGPLCFLVLQGKQTFQDLFEAVGWTKLPDMDASLSEQEREAWLFWVENDFFPRNQKIEDLIASKAHLIEGKAMSESFLEFL